MKKVIFFSLFVLLFSCAISSLAFAEDKPVAPEFSLKNLDGETVSLSDFQGKVVVISFWATWCAPCLQELPHLGELYESHKDEGLVVLAINNEGSDTLAAVRRTVKRKRFKMPVLLDLEGEVTALLNPVGTNPYTVFIDRQGRIVAQHEGYAPGDEEEHAKTIKELLKEATP